jgi:hypothetical protein
VFPEIFMAFLAIEALYDWILKISFRETMNWKQWVPYVALYIARNDGFLVMVWRYSALTGGMFMLGLFVVQTVANILAYPDLQAKIVDLCASARRYNMKGKMNVDPWWAVLTVWGVVNGVNLLQAAGFLSRVVTGTRAINQLLGLGIIALAFPAGLALVAFIRARTAWRQWIGPAVFLIFLTFMIVVEYIWQIEFRSPMRYNVLVPYLVLFFGSILLMGLPMFRMNQRLWLVTVATTILLLGSMVIAMYRGVG